MNEKWIWKMIQQSFEQYEMDGRLSEEEAAALVAKVREQRETEGSEWFEAVEDAVYGYVTNQELN
ncbi:YqzH family protein [Metabacillus indicus]|uniref:YqzH family protein n=1 Tax=Metabacillus TaxID=2675233 RepID=UPI001939EFC2|nr:MULTISPECIES: YqzH family protein [Metabacillus]MDX8290785.1 YqzH family protein [Metabacillus indicus]